MVSKQNIVVLRPTVNFLKSSGASASLDDGGLPTENPRLLEYTHHYRVCAPLTDVRRPFLLHILCIIHMNEVGPRRVA